MGGIKEAMEDRGAYHIHSRSHVWDNCYYSCIRGALGGSAMQLDAISIAITVVVGFNFGFLVSSYNLFLKIYLVKLPLPQLSTISTENILKIFCIELFEVMEDLGCI